MAPQAEPVPELLPRRARYLIPAGVPHRGEVAAGCALALVLAHLLLAQLTLGLALAFTALGRASRWRPWWLLAPAAAGLAWALTIGPAVAVAGFTAGPAALWHLGAGHPAGQSWQPLAVLGGIRDWLPRQFPLALIAGAAEAALLGWLAWLHTDEWAVRPPRPGAIAAIRRAVAVRRIGAGLVVTRRGCALGVAPLSGAVAELRWAEAAGGTLIVGAAEREVSVAALQVIHAALRRRKPVIVLAAAEDAPALARVLNAACRAAGVPLLTEAPRDGGAVDLARVVAERCAVLLAAGADQACARLVALAADLVRLGVDGDAVIWVPRAERAPAPSLRELLQAGPAAGLAVLAGTVAPEPATELAAIAATVLIRRVADPRLAAGLAQRAGIRLLPRSLAAPSAEPVPDGPPADRPGGQQARGADLVPSPVVAARTLLTLGTAEFVLAAGGPRPRLIAPGTLVTARLPSPPPREAGAQGVSA